MSVGDVTPRVVSDADIRAVNTHFRCHHVGDVLIEKGYWMLKKEETES